MYYALNKCHLKAKGGGRAMPKSKVV